MPDLITTRRTSPNHGLPTLGRASPLMLCDRLITLAQDADRAGLAVTAEHLVHLARGVFEDQRLPA